MGTLTDEEAERVFGGLRREFQLSLQDFRTRDDVQDALDEILDFSRTRNLGRSGRTVVRERADIWFRVRFPREHRTAVRQKKEMKIKQRVRVRKVVTRRPVFRDGVKVFRKKIEFVVNKRWSEQEEEKLEMLYPRKDETAKSIASLLNRTPGSVAGKANRLGLKKRRKKFDVGEI